MIARWRSLAPPAISSAAIENAVTIAVPRSGSTTIRAQTAPGDEQDRAACCGGRGSAAGGR